MTLGLLANFCVSSLHSSVCKMIVPIYDRLVHLPCSYTKQDVLLSKEQGMSYSDDLVLMNYVQAKFLDIPNIKMKISFS